MLGQRVGVEGSAAAVTHIQRVFVVLLEGLVIVLLSGFLRGPSDCHFVEVGGLLRQLFAFASWLLLLFVQELDLALLDVDVDGL